MRTPVVALDAASRVRLLADGLRTQGEQIATHAHMEIWPILNSSQLRNVTPRLHEFATDLTATASFVAGSGVAGLDGAVAGIDELAQYAQTTATTSRGALKSIGTRAATLADQLDAAVPATTPQRLAAPRESLFEVLNADSANLTSRQARTVLAALPPGIAGPQAQAYLGLSSPEHAAEFVHTVQKIGRLEASTFDRERLGIIELLGAATPEADAKLRSLALAIVERDPSELKPSAWKRLSWLLELDASSRVLDVPRALGGSSRDFVDVAARRATSVSVVSGTPSGSRTGPVTARYFERAREVLRAHVDPSGAPIEPWAMDPNMERLLQTRPPEIEQFVADLGRVGASSFDEIERALVFVDEHAQHAISEGHALTPLLTDTRALVAKNLDHVRGISNNGYGRHPDYGELGRIRGNAQLLVELQHAAEEAAEQAAPVADAAATGGSIAW